jgi:hypothetical protein
MGKNTHSAPLLAWRQSTRFRETQQAAAWHWYALAHHACWLSVWTMAATRSNRHPQMFIYGYTQARDGP